MRNKRFFYRVFKIKKEDILLNGLYQIPQIVNPSYKKIRKPEDSLISIEELKTRVEYIYITK